MPLTETLAIAALLLATAALYASVGHGGASGYLAVMGLFGFAPAVMKPTALALNIVVSAVATVRFYRAGLFEWRLFWPFAIVSIPAAFLGGGLVVPARAYKILVGLVLLYAAVWMFRSTVRVTSDAPGSDLPPRPPAVWLALPAGLLIGFLSGMTGVGGGIFLSPLILYAGWAETRATSGVAAPFILVNSIAGLLGHLAGLAGLPPQIPIWAGAVLIGGWIGASYGTARAPTNLLRRLLSLVLVIAAVKLILL
jgi:uncharacterized membrane protein YfcA